MGAVSLHRKYQPFPLSSGLSVYLGSTHLSLCRRGCQSTQEVPTFPSGVGAVSLHRKYPPFPPVSELSVYTGSTHLSLRCRSCQSTQEVPTFPSGVGSVSLHRKYPPFPLAWELSVYPGSPCRRGQRRTPSARGAGCYEAWTLCRGSERERRGKSSDTGTGAAYSNPL